MARKPRIHYSGAIYHVMLRGNGGMDIFIDDQDRMRLCLLLQEGVERFGHRILAFCLMDNHIHLVVQVGTIPLSRIMQNLSFRHTQWINKRRKSTGHLFQGRFKAILVDGDCYLLQLVAYLHLNPLRVHIVDAAGQYSWSSHRAYLGMESIPWLTVEPVLSQFSSNTERAQAQFDTFVADQIGAEYHAAFHGSQGTDSRLLGDDDFVSQALRREEMDLVLKPKIDDVLRVFKDKFDVSVDELRVPNQERRLSELRALLAWCVLEFSDGSLAELSTLVDRDLSTLSAAVKRIKIRSERSGEVLQKMKHLKEDVQRLAILQA